MRVPRTLFIIALAACAAFGQDKPRGHSASIAKGSLKADEAQIRTLYDDWAQAFRAKNIDGIMSFYAPGDNVVTYDIIPPLEYKGFDSYRKDYIDFMAPFQGRIGVEFREMRVFAGGDVAFVHCLEHITGTMKKDNQKVDVWLRATSGLRRIKGKWLIVHDHISVPADFATGKAVMDLKP